MSSIWKRENKFFALLVFAGEIENCPTVILTPTNQPAHWAKMKDLQLSVFNIATANRDDHLPNHGFIRTPAGWRLAPAFYMNPSFRKAEHVLSLDLYNHQPDFQVAIATAEYYRMDSARAGRIVSEVCKVVKEWKVCARRIGLSEQECSEAEHLFCYGN